MVIFALKRFSGKLIKEIKKMKETSRREIVRRVLSIVLFAVLCIIIPYIITFLLISMTGDRVQGMKLGVVPGVLITHMVFGMFYLQTVPWIRMIVTLVATGLIYYLLIQSITHELIHTNWDENGYWDLTATNFLIGVIVWEIAYHLVVLLNKALKITTYTDDE